MHINCTLENPLSRTPYILHINRNLIFEMAFDRMMNF